MAELGRERGYSSLPELEAQLQQPPGQAHDEPTQVKTTSVLKRILRWRKYLILALTPILLMPIPIAISGTVSGLLVSNFCQWSTVFGSFIFKLYKLYI